MTFDNLTDKVHAIMIEELLDDLNGAMVSGKAQGLGNGLIKTEEPFNVYGNRGFVDVLHYGKWTVPRRDELTDEQIEILGGKDLSKGVLSIYECKPRITNLNETLRQVRKYSEYMVQDFTKRYPKRPVGLCYTSLVLLNTKENCDMILKFEKTFVATFQNKSSCNPFETKNRMHLTMFDPLEEYINYYDPTRSLDQNIKVASRQCERLRTVVFDLGDRENAADFNVIGRESLCGGYHYVDAKDFYERYLEKRT